MTSPGVFRPRLTRSSRSARQAASLSLPMFLTASSTFWPSCRTPSATSREIDVACLSSRTRTSVHPQMAAETPRGRADSLEEAGDKLFTFTRFPKSQWKSIRTSNAIERLHEKFKRRIKTQTVLPSAETAAMLFWALLASGQITMRKADGWQSLAEKPCDQIIDLAA